MKKESIQLLNYIAQAIYDKKGFNIVAIDVRGVSSMTDFFLVAEGSVDRHVSGMARHLMQILKQEGERPTHDEGLKEGDWVVLDYTEIVIHLLTPQMREKYHLDELWHEGKIVDVDLKIQAI
jgi:ribosome-associated protein